MTYASILHVCVCSVSASAPSRVTNVGSAWRSDSINDPRSSQLTFANRTILQQGDNLPPIIVIVQWPIGQKRRLTSPAVRHDGRRTRPPLSKHRGKSRLVSGVRTSILIHVVRIEGEELVSQADIAGRTGRTRQAVNHWIKRDADSSGFPEPAYGISTRSPLWRWTDVQEWLEPDGQADDRSRIIALANAALLARHNVHDDEERKLVESLLAAS